MQTYTDYNKMRDIFIMFLIFMIGILMFNIKVLHDHTSITAKLAVQNSEMISTSIEIDEITLETIEVIAKRVTK